MKRTEEMEIVMYRNAEELGIDKKEGKERESGWLPRGMIPFSWADSSPLLPCCRVPKFGRKRTESKM